MKKHLHALLVLSTAILAYTHHVAASSILKTEINDASWTTGKKVWDENRVISQINVTNFLKRHSCVPKEILEYFQSCHAAGTMYGPVDFNIGSYIHNDLNLKFKGGQGSIVELNLYKLLDGTFVELITQMNQLTQDSAYNRKDLERINKFAADSYVYLEGLKNVLLLLYEGQASDYNEDAIKTFLDAQPYKRGHEIEDEFNSAGLHFLLNYPDGISLLQWGKTFCSFYQHYFANTYIFTRAHLKSKNKMTKVQLKRYDPKLTDGADLFFNNDIASKLAQPAVAPAKPKKAKKKKPKKVTPEAVQTPKENAPQAPSKIFDAPSAVAPALPNTMPTIPEDASRTPISQPQVVQTAAASDAREDAVARQARKEAKRQAKKDAKASRLTQAHAEEGHPVHLRAATTETTAAAAEGETAPFHDERLNELDEILAAYEGGPQIGMKSRTLLGLLSALSNGGFLEFFANGNEAVVKTETMKSVLHVSKHSAHQKSPGASGNTVKQIKDIINDIREGLRQQPAGTQSGPSGAHSAAATRGEDDSSDQD